MYSAPEADAIGLGKPVHQGTTCLFIVLGGAMPKMLLLMSYLGE
jgi:hypothetical protein